MIKRKNWAHNKKIEILKNFKGKLRNKKALLAKFQKKWRFWRAFRTIFWYSKRANFFNKLKWRFNTMRIIRHHLLRFYLPKKKYITCLYNKKIGHNKFFFFIRKLELRLGVILLRARFFVKLINSYKAIKLNLIAVNGIIINKINFQLKIQDLFQKRRTYKCKGILQKRKNEFFKRGKYYKIDRLIYSRKFTFKWRRYRWKKARYLLWKTRRASHFNLFLAKKQNTTLNYLEINYKVPAGIIIKQPFFKELALNKKKKFNYALMLQKIYFVY